MHLIFRICLEKNTHQTSYISAVEHAITRDETGRIYMQSSRSGTGVKVRNDRAARWTSDGYYLGTFDLKLWVIGQEIMQAHNDIGEAHKVHGETICDCRKGQHGASRRCSTHLRT